MDGQIKSIAMSDNDLGLWILGRQNLRMTNGRPTRCAWKLDRLSGGIAARSVSPYKLVLCQR